MSCLLVSSVCGSASCHPARRRLFAQNGASVFTGSVSYDRDVCPGRCSSVMQREVTKHRPLTLAFSPTRCLDRSLIFRIEVVLKCGFQRASRRDHWWLDSINPSIRLTIKEPSVNILCLPFDVKPLFQPCCTPLTCTLSCNGSPPALGTATIAEWKSHRFRVAESRVALASGHWPTDWSGSWGGAHPVGRQPRSGASKAAICLQAFNSA